MSGYVRSTKPIPGGNTTVRTVRVSAPLWNSARAIANDDGTDLSTLIRLWLAEYVDAQR